jgi:hypothetical protein
VETRLVRHQRHVSISCRYSANHSLRFLSPFRAESQTAVVAAGATEKEKPMAVEVSYAVNVRLPNGQYVTLTITAISDTAAASAAVAMTGGEVGSIARLG